MTEDQEDLKAAEEALEKGDFISFEDLKEELYG